MMFLTASEKSVRSKKIFNFISSNLFCRRSMYFCFPFLIAYKLLFVLSRPVKLLLLKLIKSKIDLFTLWIARGIPFKELFFLDVPILFMQLLLSIS